MADDSDGWTLRMLAYVQSLMMDFGSRPDLERLEAYLIRRFEREDDRG